MELTIASLVVLPIIVFGVMLLIKRSERYQHWYEIQELNNKILPHKYRHLKTGKIYMAYDMFIAKNATNDENDGEEMMVYCNQQTGNHFVRELKEFNKKFRRK